MARNRRVTSWWSCRRCKAHARTVTFDEAARGSPCPLRRTGPRSSQRILPAAGTFRFAAPQLLTALPGRPQRGPRSSHDPHPHVALRPRPPRPDRTRHDRGGPATEPGPPFWRWRVGRWRTPLHPVRVAPSGFAPFRAQRLTPLGALGLPPVRSGGDANDISDREPPDLPASDRAAGSDRPAPL